MAKTVGEEREEGRDVEDQDDPKMGTTGTQIFVLRITGWKTKDGMEDKATGDRNENRIQTHGQKGHSQPIDNIDSDVGTGQSSNAHVLTVCVCHDIVTTIWESPQQEDEGGDNICTPEYTHKADSAYDRVIEDGCVSQLVADSYILIEGHGKKN